MLCLYNLGTRACLLIGLMYVTGNVPSDSSPLTVVTKDVLFAHNVKRMSWLHFLDN